MHPGSAPSVRRRIYETDHLVLNFMKTATYFGHRDTETEKNTSR
jgi:hypothetical protein